MGMFDQVRCELPLPVGQDERYQTKDTECQMWQYVIAKDGRLMLEHGDAESTEQNFDGDLHFYDLEIDYRATFRKGNCIEICQATEAGWDQVWKGGL